MTQRWASTRAHRLEDIAAQAPEVKKLAKEIIEAISRRLHSGVSDQERRILTYASEVRDRAFPSRAQLQRDKENLASRKAELLRIDPNYFDKPQSEFRKHQLTSEPH